MRLTKLDYGLRVPAGLLASNVLGGENGTFKRWAAPADRHGTIFRVSIHIRTGHEIWHGWFWDRREALVFMAGIQKRIPLFDLPTPWPTVPIGIHEVEGAYVKLAVTTGLTAVTGSNQTYSVPTDWNSSDNAIHTIGAGGGGGKASAGSGGGGAYSGITNLSLTPGGSATYQLGTGGTGATSGSSGTTGGDTWFNDTTLAASDVGAKGGVGGVYVGGLTPTAGGATASGVGTTKYKGGDSGGGYLFSTDGAGGAAGPSGAGGNGGAGSGGSSSQNIGAGGGGGANGGGNGSVGSGTTGGAAGTGGGQGGSSASPPATGSAGTAGTTWGSWGPGGGPGGTGCVGNQVEGAAGRAGALYGAGGSSGSAGSGGGNGGNGAQGVIVLIYTPAASSNLFRPVPF